MAKRRKARRRRTSSPPVRRSQNGTDCATHGGKQSDGAGQKTHAPRAAGIQGHGNEGPNEMHRGNVKAALQQAGNEGGCTDAQKVDQMTLKVKPIRVAENDGSDPTDKADFATTTSIFAKAGIEVQEQAETTVNDSTLKDISFSGDTVTTELQSVYNRFNNSDYVGVLTVETFNDGSTSSRTNTGGGRTVSSSSTGVSILVHDGANWLCAHEVGHAPGGDHGTHGTDSNGDNTVMNPTGDPDKIGSGKVSRALGTTWRGHSLTKAGSGKVCPDYSD